MKCHHHGNHNGEFELCVSKVPIFNHLNQEEMKEIASLIQSKTFKKGEVIFSANSSINELFIIHTGRVKIYRLSESGREQILRVLEAKEFMGELTLFNESLTQNYAEATEKTEICVIQKLDLQKLIEKKPSIALRILEEFSRRLTNADQLIQQLGSADVETRLASVIIDLSNKQISRTVTLPMSKRDLASLIGTTQETISRKLSTFQEHGWIKQTGQRVITILNMEQLISFTEGKK
ncbi:Crp/Fnr family transcriptional regulator [Chengkuizengella axinellae]|uniref:Crp/Fnr family transcriptional regulator n=1 Tax=Chengkuizengella axinellae TaxID=3064388 RepID=A0ABT9J142_9BACL|nr:Crp/Fnr family transcriptional regulator [Chengkuizengella sp. 2205SS18-9]MDP5275318.1 Crp/Fnr family transcriptional regulator [Chengkuizengella sp. 2205SS18-9]